MSGFSFEQVTLLMMAFGTFAPYLFLLRYCLKHFKGWQRKLALAPLPVLAAIMLGAFGLRQAGTMDSGVFALIVSVASILGVLAAFLCGILLVKHFSRHQQAADPS